jgi:hypothetical protein
MHWILRFEHCAHKWIRTLDHARVIVSSLNVSTSQFLQHNCWLSVAIIFLTNSLALTEQRFQVSLYTR